MYERIAVSTSTFIDMSNPIRQGINIVGSRLVNSIDAKEIDHTLKVAEEFDIGLELAYRVGVENYLQLLQHHPGGVLQIHGPIFSNIFDATRHGFVEQQGNPLITQLKQAVMNPIIGRFAQGTLDRDWEKTRSLAQTLSTPNVVLHPRGPLHLKKINAQTDGVIIGIEPDFKRITESEYIIWRIEDVMKIAEETNAGIIIDISHITISTNSLQAVSKVYEQAKKAPKGVVGIHFNVAIPSENREDFFTKGTGSRPLYRDTPDNIKGLVLDFYQQVINDPEFSGPIVLEFWSFLPRDNSFESRKRGVGETLEVLAGSTTPPRSYSTQTYPRIK